MATTVQTRACLGYFRWIESSWGFSGGSQFEQLSRAFRPAKAAVAQDQNDEIARALVTAVCWMAGDRQKAVSKAELSIQLNADANPGQVALADALVFSDSEQLGVAMTGLTRAVRIEPRDDEFPQIHAFTGVAHFVAGQYPDPKLHCRKALELDPSQSSPAHVIASIMGHDFRIPKLT